MKHKDAKDSFSPDKVSFAKQKEKFRERVAAIKSSKPVKKVVETIERLPVPDGKNVHLVCLDADTVNFLKKGFGTKISPYIKDAETYSRNVWYVKCCGAKEKSDFAEADSFFKDCLTYKDKADDVFEIIYSYAKDEQLLSDVMGESDQNKFSELTLALSTASNATINDFLQLAFYGEQGKGNQSVANTFSVHALKHFTDVFPETKELIDERFNAMQGEASHHFGQYLCPDFDTLPSHVKDQYVKIIQQRPKSVLAFGVMSKVYLEKGATLRVKSPKDLLEQLDNDSVMEATEKLLFRDITGSMNNLAQKVKDGEIVYRPQGRNALKFSRNNTGKEI